MSGGIPRHLDQFGYLADHFHIPSTCSDALAQQASWFGA